MDDLQTQLNNYLCFCETQKRLDPKTIKAYRIDLRQFTSFIQFQSISEITPVTLEKYIASLHQAYKPKTAKRKIASLKAFFHYLEYKDIIEKNPFSKIQVKFREPIILPKTIPLNTMETFLATMYKQRSIAKTAYQKRSILLDIAVIETLFATGMRISELCSLKEPDVNLYDRSILIYGKGAKERRIQLGNDDVVQILHEYKHVFYKEIKTAIIFLRISPAIRSPIRLSVE